MPEIKILGLDDAPEELREALGKMVEGLTGNGPKRDQGAAVISLKELYERYTAPITFSAGDFVTPRKGSHLKNEGEPFIVLEVNQFAEPDFKSVEVGDTSYGSRPQVRIATTCRCPQGGYVMWWVEAHLLEAWAPATSETLNS